MGDGNCGSGMLADKSRGFVINVARLDRNREEKVKVVRHVRHGWIRVTDHDVGPPLAITAKEAWPDCLRRPVMPTVADGGEAVVEIVERQNISLVDFVGVLDHIFNLRT
jgi:hypothetical protein